MAITGVFDEFELEEGLDLAAKDDMTVYGSACSLRRCTRRYMCCICVFLCSYVTGISHNRTDDLCIHTIATNLYRQYTNSSWMQTLFWENTHNNYYYMQRIRMNSSRN